LWEKNSSSHHTIVQVLENISTGDMLRWPDKRLHANKGILFSSGYLKASERPDELAISSQNQSCSSVNNFSLSSPLSSHWHHHSSRVYAVPILAASAAMELAQPLAVPMILGMSHNLVLNHNIL
jgi:hypothetical protein